MDFYVYGPTRSFADLMDARKSTREYTYNMNDTINLVFFMHLAWWLSGYG